MSTNRFRSQLDAAGAFVDEVAADGVYPDGLTEAAIDALIEQVDLNLAADEFAAEAAFRCDFTDQRRASRARRRAGRELLRSNYLVAGSQRQGKTAVFRAFLVEGEAA
ncbi:hypothetical protein VSH64_37045 [Amycolatopsis rhabdoformis]|uniref:Uncharacterized protein n=1 Tax=Amycolatopsis rhabdoformis TaxID=1448059 RepID=A0ABZ1I4G8_9PSEU|nr:hypothetical protein [Amycolatopsis rhabdoformis]WSE28403.1 hypothetical protein VSH64_37045 [Amycolatopsis rhabdoformis]